jgi:Holliday junction resolvasome RuvABC ATP-dependent DNA helicase subunit
LIVGLLNFDGIIADGQNSTKRRVDVPKMGLILFTTRSNYYLSENINGYSTWG